MERLIAKALSPISRRLRLIVGRAVIRLVNDARLEQEVQLSLLADEVGQAERYQHYGFTSHPHPGAEAIVVSIGGSRSHLVTVADGDRKYRLKSLSQGEVALYTDEGDSIVLKRGRIVEVNTQTMRINASTLCEINAPTLTVNASTGCSFDTPALSATGSITDLSGTGGKSMGDMRSTYNGHTHNDPQGGTVPAPNQQM